MLNRIEELLNSNVNFSFETTLATKSFVNTIRKAKLKDYHVTLIFFWLESVRLAKDRVHKRVLEGGHSIEEDVIERRYFAGIKNLFNLYGDKVDELYIYDNSYFNPILIAEKELETDFKIFQPSIFNQIKTVAK